MRKASPFFYLLTIALSLHSAPIEHWFEKANRFYSDGQFDSAAFYYNQIVESGTENAAVLYNYGNALFRQKKLGAARLAYEKAACLNPADAEIAANIRFIKSNIVDRVPEPERGFLDTILWKLHILLPLKKQIWLVFILWCILALLIGLSFYTPRNVRLWLIYLSVLTGLLMTALGTSMGFKIHDAEKVSYAIVLVASTEAKNEPDGATTLFTAHEGTKFRIRKTADDWVLVNLPNGVSGWVEKKALGII